MESSTLQDSFPRKLLMVHTFCPITAPTIRCWNVSVGNRLVLVLNWNIAETFGDAMLMVLVGFVVVWPRAITWTKSSAETRFWHSVVDILHGRCSDKIERSSHRNKKRSNSMNKKQVSMYFGIRNLILLSDDRGIFLYAFINFTSSGIIPWNPMACHKNNPNFGSMGVSPHKNQSNFNFW